MPLNKRRLNSVVINSDSYYYGSGGGTLITFTQQVELLETTSDLTLITFTQQVIATNDTSDLITFVQLVRDVTQSTFTERNGWYPVLVIDGIRIPDSQIHGRITVTRTENDSAAMSFTLIPGAGVINFALYEGKRVTLDVYLSNGTGRRVYTGIVNIPDIELIHNKLIFTCNDNRREQLNAQFVNLLPYIGYYSEDAFGKVKDVSEELDKRLQTTPTCVDFDANGFFTITPMLAKATPDFTFNSGDIHREDGHESSILFTPRSRIVNTIKVKATYQFQRLYHKTMSFSWFAPFYNDPCGFLENSYSLPLRLMIKQAAEAAGWPIMGDIAYTPVLNAGFYSCLGGTRAWSTASNTYATAPKTETVRQTDGTFADVTVKDAAGKPVNEAILTSTQDIGSTLCFGAEWLATKRWSQNISENYTLTITAPQSVTQYGVVTQDDTMGVSSEYDSSAWDGYNEYTQPPVGVTTYPAQPAVDYWIDADTNLNSWSLTVGLVLQKAKTTIIKAHRDNRAIFYTSIKPFLDLVHTVRINDVRFDVTGKVRSLTHVMDVSTGEAYTKTELAFSRAVGSATTTTNHLPPRPLYIPASHLQLSGTNLDSHYGVDPATENENNPWTGYIGNKSITAHVGTTTNTLMTTYPVSFVVDVPEVPPDTRENKELIGSESYELALQNDPCTITFLDKF